MTGLRTTMAMKRIWSKPIPSHSATDSPTSSTFARMTVQFAA